MLPNKVHSALVRAFDSLIDRDIHLLKVDACERSITHRLALHLSREFSDHDVDCEFNRNGFDVKRLQLSERPARDDDDEAVTVFPDIVVHHRGNNDHNLLVIEVKKHKPHMSSAYDIQKLKAFRRDLGYQFAAHAIIGLDRKGKLVRKVAWINE